MADSELKSCTLYNLKETLGQKKLSLLNWKKLKKAGRILRRNHWGKASKTENTLLYQRRGRFDTQDAKFCWNRDENRKSGKAYKYKQETKVRAAKLDK